MPGLFKNTEATAEKVSGRVITMVGTIPINLTHLAIGLLLYFIAIIRSNN